MPMIRIYEAALCCETGVCGVDVDETLVNITAEVRDLQTLGVDIRRHNLGVDPIEFTRDDTVVAFMRTVGSSGLPLTVVDGVTVAAGAYPTRQVLRAISGVPTAPPSAQGRTDLGLSASAAQGCCGGSGCC